MKPQLSLASVSPSSSGIPHPFSRGPTLRFHSLAKATPPKSAIGGTRCMPVSAANDRLRCGVAARAAWTRHKRVDGADVREINLWSR